MAGFTREELEIAKTADLRAVASSLGYTVKRIGSLYTLKEMDSIRIYGDNHWFRWSRKNEKGNNGGSQIDFLRVFAGMEVKEAVFWLLDFVGYDRGKDYKNGEGGISVSGLINRRPVREEDKKEFALPEPAADNNYLYRYLTGSRGISRRAVDCFVKSGLIYESRRYHNIVFKGNDKNGVTRFASLRGVFDERGKPFKCDVAGNDKRYGFNIAYDDSNEVIVFEAAIDLMSYADIFSDYGTNKIALGMLGDAPLETFLGEHPHISSIKFCLDNDPPGRNAAAALCEKYYGLGYEVEDAPPPAGYKDYNEWLVKAGAEIKARPEVKAHVL